MFHLFALRVVRLLTGGSPEPRYLSLPLAGGYTRRSAKRLGYVPCRLTDGGTVEAVDYHGSAHLSALLQSDGFFVVAEGVKTLSAGERVRVLPVGRLWE